MTVLLQYYDRSGGGDTLDWEVELNEKEEAAYLAALAAGQDPNDCEELAHVLSEAEEAILAYEKKNMADWADEEDIEALDICAFFPTGGSMEDKLNAALTAKYAGRQAKEGLDLNDLEYEELLEAKVGSYLEDEDEEEEDDGPGAKEYMGISVDLDESDRVSEVCVSFHTSCWGDSGLGEEDPEDYWSFEECFSAASAFVEDLLE